MAPFVLRVGLRSCFTQPTAFFRLSTNETLAVSKRNIGHSASTPRFSARTAILRYTQRNLPLILTATGIAGATLGMFSLASPSTLYSGGALPSKASHLPPPSDLSEGAIELGLDTVCGFFVGLFVIGLFSKKAVRILVFLFGGLFVVLQYFDPSSSVEVDWERNASPFENLLYRADASGNGKLPSIQSIWKWIVNSLTSYGANSPPKPSFIRGLSPSEDW